jgi:hypothetical protein
MKELPIGCGAQSYTILKDESCPLVEKLKLGIKKDLRRYRYKKAGNLSYRDLPSEVKSIANMLDVGQSFKSKYISTLKRIK